MNKKEDYFRVLYIFFFLKLNYYEGNKYVHIKTVNELKICYFDEHFFQDINSSILFFKSSWKV